MSFNFAKKMKRQNRSPPPLRLYQQKKVLRLCLRKKQAESAREPGFLSTSSKQRRRPYFQCTCSFAKQVTTLSFLCRALAC